MVTNPTFVAGTAWFADFTAEMCILSKYLQADHVRYKTAQALVKSCLANLRAAYTELPEGEFPGGPRLERVLSAVRDHAQYEENLATMELDYRGPQYEVDVGC